MADVAVLGASGYAGAIAATLLYRHPYFELRHVTARSEAGRGARRRSTRARACRWCSRTTTPTSRATSTPRSSAGRTASRRPAVAALRERGVRVVDLSADFRLRDRAVYEDWYGRHGAPELFGDGRLRAARARTATAIAGADLVANPGCYPTAALLGLAPLARAGVIADVVIDAKSGVSGAGREPIAHDPLHLRRREPHALQGRAATATRRRSSRSWPCSGAALAGHLHAAPRAARAGRARRRATSRRRARVDDAELADLYREAYERRAAGSSCRSARRACSRCARPTTAASPCTSTAARGPRDRVRGDRQPVEGRGLAGGAEPQPDVRARRARGAASERAPASPRRWVTLPGMRRSDGRLPAGFRAAGVACGLKPSGGTDLGLLVSDAPDDRQRRALHALRRARRAGAARARSAAGSTGCAPSSPTPATPTPPPGAAASTTPRRCRAPRAMAAGVEPGPGRGRLHRRDRRAAADRPDRARASLAARGELRRRRRRAPSARRSAPPTCSPSGRRSTSRCRAAPCG